MNTKGSGSLDITGGIVSPVIDIQTIEALRLLLDTHI
jgi:hypothetical protein